MRILFLKMEFLPHVLIQFIDFRPTYFEIGRNELVIRLFILKITSLLIVLVYSFFLATVGVFLLEQLFWIERFFSFLGVLSITQLVSSLLIFFLHYLTIIEFLSSYSSKYQWFSYTCNMLRTRCNFAICVYLCRHFLQLI